MLKTHVKIVMNSMLRYLSKRGLKTSSGMNGKEDKMDFVQELFLRHIREYYRRLKENEGKLFEVSPELEKEREWKAEMLRKAYAGDLSEDEFNKFPTFTFKEPEMDGINVDDQAPRKKPK